MQVNPPASYVVDNGRGIVRSAGGDGAPERMEQTIALHLVY